MTAPTFQPAPMSDTAAETALRALVDDRLTLAALPSLTHPAAVAVQSRIIRAELDLMTGCHTPADDWMALADAVGVAR